MSDTSNMRDIKLSELRAQWAIKQRQSTQLSQAIEILAAPGIEESRYFCPVCKQPLTVNHSVWDGNWFLFCAYGPCAEHAGGEAANQGHEGLTEEEAYRALVQAIEKEQEAG